MAVIKANYNQNQYDVVINPTAIEKFRFYINTNRDVLIISDENVAKHYLDLVKNQFTRPHTFVIKPSENSKTLEVYAQIIDFMIQKELDRDVLVLALGGGVVTDLAGFVAATYMRGVEYISVPTSSLAMVDSSIGGKTALNHQGVKNIIGNFYHPSKVLIDPNTLKTLKQEDYHSGLVEALKAGIIGDKEIISLLFDQKAGNIEAIIERSLHVKNKIVQQDECDENIRHLLNYGHTIGHALELEYGLSHGQAVLSGMYHEEDNPKVIQVIEEFSKLYQIEIIKNINQELIKKYLKLDKKLKGDSLKIVKIPELGQSYLKEITLDQLLQGVKI